MICYNSDRVYISHILFPLPYISHTSGVQVDIRVHIAIGSLVSFRYRRKSAAYPKVPCSSFSGNINVPPCSIPDNKDTYILHTHARPVVAHPVLVPFYRSYTGIVSHIPTEVNPLYAIVSFLCVYESIRGIYTSCCKFDKSWLTR